jgi:TonB family protein
VGGGSPSSGSGGFGDSGDFNPDRNGSGQGVNAEQDVDFGSYTAVLKSRVKRNWIDPESGTSRIVDDGPSGSVTLNFRVSRSGHASRIRVVNSSGSPLLDQAAQNAIIHAEPFGPLLLTDYRGDCIGISADIVLLRKNLYGDSLLDVFIAKSKSCE